MVLPRPAGQKVPVGWDRRAPTVIKSLPNNLRHAADRLANVSGVVYVIGMSKGIENKAYIEAMRQLRRSSATTPHEDSRTKRARTRKASKDKAIKDSKEQD